MATVSRTELGTLGGASSIATDVNEAGVVVGWAKIATGADHAFRWTQTHGMVDLGTLPGDQWSRAINITKTGHILGMSGGTGTGTIYGTPVTWDSSGTATRLPIPLLPGGALMSLADQNVMGQVIGYEIGGSLAFVHAWIWSESVGVYDITAHIPGGRAESYAVEVNRWGLVIGTNNGDAVCRDPGVTEQYNAFVWSLSTGYRNLGFPSGYNPCKAQVRGGALNDQGVVVGSVSSSGYTSSAEPYKWTDGTGFTMLPTFSPAPYNSGYAQSVNAMGTAVGASMDVQDGAVQAAAWPTAGGIVKLSPDVAYASVAMATNTSGVVVGWSSPDGATHATIWKLRPGRGASTPTLASLPRSPMFAAPAQSGPSGCLSDARSLISKQLLLDCIVRRQN